MLLISFRSSSTKAHGIMIPSRTCPSLQGHLLRPKNFEGVDRHAAEVHHHLTAKGPSKAQREPTATALGPRGRCLEHGHPELEHIPRICRLKKGVRCFREQGVENHVRRAATNQIYPTHAV